MAETQYGFGGAGESNRVDASSGYSEGTMTDNLLHVSIYYNSLNTRYVVREKVYGVRL